MLTPHQSRTVPVYWTICANPELAGLAAIGSKHGHFTARTPIQRRLPIPMRHPLSCDVQ